MAVYAYRLTSFRPSYFHQIVSNETGGVSVTEKAEKGPEIARSGVCVNVFPCCERKEPCEGFRTFKGALRPSKICSQTCFSLHLSKRQRHRVTDSHAFTAHMFALGSDWIPAYKLSVLLWARILWFCSYECQLNTALIHFDIALTGDELTS